jgi:hypothetical protein
MINPYGFLLGAGMWAALRLLALWKIPTARARRLVGDTLGLVVGGVCGFGVFWLAGLMIFPGRS